MIVSVSRRTDIPCRYADWFFNRLHEGYALVRNPMRRHSVSRVPLGPGAVDCFVFWTKNPLPMLPRLGELGTTPFYFQFTLTPYGKDVEPGLPSKREILLPAFRTLAEKIGPERVIWRYDPILLTPRYTPEYHRRAFAEIAAALNGSTRRCTVSFCDDYSRSRTRMEEFGLIRPGKDEMLRLLAALSQTARREGMALDTCAEPLDTASLGIPHAHCIDADLVASITGRPFRAPRDRSQRPACGCAASVDIGAYHTCPNGCRYCYATGSFDAAARSAARYDPDSPLLCSALAAEDTVTERSARSSGR